MFADPVMMKQRRLGRPADKQGVCPRPRQMIENAGKLVPVVNPLKRQSLYWCAGDHQRIQRLEQLPGYGLVDAVQISPFAMDRIMCSHAHGDQFDIGFGLAECPCELSFGDFFVRHEVKQSDSQRRLRPVCRYCQPFAFQRAEVCEMLGNKNGHDLDSIVGDGPAECRTKDPHDREMMISKYSDGTFMLPSIATSNRSIVARISRSSAFRPFASRARNALCTGP